MRQLYVAVGLHPQYDLLLWVVALQGFKEKGFPGLPGNTRI